VYCKSGSRISKVSKLLKEMNGKELWKHSGLISEEQLIKQIEDNL
jgi:hypothetical protein